MANDPEKWELTEVNSEIAKLTEVNSEIAKLTQTRHDLMKRIAKRKPFFDWHDWEDPLCPGNWFLILFGLCVTCTVVGFVIALIVRMMR